MKMKQLKEKRNKLIADLELKVSAIGAEDEVRSLTEEEIADFNAIKKEIEGVDATIKIVEEARTKTMTVEEKVEVAKDVAEKRALDKFFRGMDLAAEERTILASTSSNQALFPLEISKSVLKRLEEACPVLDMAKRFSSKGTLRLLREDSYGSAGLTGENTQFPESDVTFSHIELKAFKVSTAVHISFEMLKNSEIDLTQYLTDVIIRRLSREMNKMFIVGTGVNQPEGLLQAKGRYTIAADLTINDLIMMSTALHPSFMDKAAWIVNRATFQKIACLVDGLGRNYLISNYVGGKVTYTLLGLPLIVDVNVPELEAGNKAIILANIQEALAINILQDFNIRHLVEMGYTQGIETFAGYCMMDSKIINEDAIILGVVGNAVVKKK